MRRDRRVLITGGHGFIGRHVARRFADAGWEVAAVGHGTWSEDELKRWGISLWHSCDITLKALTTYGGEPDAIIHCAGSSQVGFSISHPLHDFKRTVDTTAATLEFLRKLAPRATMLLISSAAVYGEALSERISESTPAGPISPYGVHKHLAEQLCASYAKMSDLHIIVLRLFSVYGPWLRKQLLWDACTKLTAQAPEFAGSGEELRDWLHVSDAASLIYTLADKRSDAYTLFNGGTGIGVSVSDVLSELSAALGARRSPSFTGKQRVGNPSSMVADTARARSVGWKPAYDWRTGVREYADWFRSVT